MNMETLSYTNVQNANTQMPHIYVDYMDTCIYIHTYIKLCSGVVEYTSTYKEKKNEMWNESVLANLKRQWNSLQKMFFFKYKIKQSYDFMSK